MSASLNIFSNVPIAVPNSNNYYYCSKEECEYKYVN